MSELPRGWVETDFDNVIDSLTNGISDKQNKESNGIPVSRIETIADQTINYSKIGFVDNYDDVKAKKYLLNEDDILFSHINSPIHLGKTAIFDGRQELFHGTNLLRIVVNKRATLPSYFNYYCKFTRAIGAFSLNAQHAVNQSSLNQKKIKAFSIPLAPLAEQKRIVEKLDEVLAQVDTIKARLDGIPAILKRFRQSVLASAVSGKLTEEWRRTNDNLSFSMLVELRDHQRQIWEKAKLDGLVAKGKTPKNDKWKEKYSEPYIESPDLLERLPKSWDWCTWEDILDQKNTPFKRGPFGSALKKSMFVDKGYKVYEQYCPINDDCSFARYFITEDKYKELIAFDVQAKDFLISCSGVTLGRITQVPDKFDAGIINQALLRLRLDSKYYDDDFFIKLFRSEYFQKKIFDSSTGSAIPNVKGVKELKAIPIPLMGLEEQKEIVRLVDQYFAFADTIEAQVKKAQARVNNLTQSILAKAFRGELVPQDPNDEPADKLLERIAQARIEAEALAKAAKKAAPKKRTTKAKTTA